MFTTISRSLLNYSIYCFVFVRITEGVCITYKINHSLTQNSVLYVVELGFIT